MKKFAPFLILLLAACTPKVEMTQGYTLGNYSVQQVTVEPATLELEGDAEYQEVAKLIPTAYAWQQLGQQGALPTRLNLKVYDVSFQVNAARAMLVGDGYRLGGEVTLIDIATNQVVAKRTVYVSSIQRGGLMGIGIGAIDNEENEKNEIIRKFANEIVMSFYPAK